MVCINVYERNVYKLALVSEFIVKNEIFDQNISEL